MNKTTFISEKYIEKTFVLQHDQSDCGVACLLSIINFYGGSNSLEKLRELSGTSKEGTSLLGLYQTANKTGFTAEGNRGEIKDLTKQKNPIILHVLVEKRLQHYVVCYGFENNKFVIGDPAKGIVNYTSEELEKIWVSKSCLSLKPNKNFTKAVESKKIKKQWLLNVLKEDYRLLIYSVLFGIAIAFLGMSMAIFSQKLIDDILPLKDTSKLIIGVILLCCLLLINVLFTYLRTYFLMYQARDFNNRIIDRFYSALLNLPKPFFDARRIGELVARLKDTERIQNVISMIAGSVIVDTLVTIVSLFFLFHYSWQTGTIAFVSLPFYFFLIYRFNKIVINAQQELMQSSAFSESNYISSIQGITAIKSNNRQTIFQKLNEFIYGNFQQKAFELAKINLRLSLFSSLFGVFFLIGILIYASIQVLHENIELGALMAILGISGSLLPSVANLAMITIPINEAKVAFHRMYEFASIKKEDKGNINLSNFNYLEIKNLSFRFAGQSLTLKKIQFSIEKNKCIAIVGESGSGKSTIAQILQKFAPFESGQILINNQHNLTQINTKDWRNIVGVVPQDITIFNGNITSNILLGKEETREKISVFCEKYGFEKFIKSLPKGYTTFLGEGGIELSGGQRQIIALMRALYKKPQLLILDEFTSALDRNTEDFVLKLINKLKSEIAILIFSHRLQSLPKIADSIHVLEKGKITAHGTHETLLKSKNFYSDFWEDLETILKRKQ